MPFTQVMLTPCRMQSPLRRTRKSLPSGERNLRRNFSAGEVSRSPNTQFVHRREESGTRGSESVGHGHRRSGLDVAKNQTSQLQVAQPFGENGVADSRDTPTQFGEPDGAVSQRSEDHATPTFPKKSKRSR